MTTLYKRVRVTVDGNEVCNEDVEVDVELEDVLDDVSFESMMDDGPYTESDVTEWVAGNCDLEDVLNEYGDEDRVLDWVHNNVDNDDIVKWAESNNYVFRVKDEPLLVGFRQSTDVSSLWVAEVDDVAIGYVFMADSATLRVAFSYGENTIDSGQIAGCPVGAAFAIVTGFARFNEKAVREFVAAEKARAGDGNAVAA